MTKNEALVKARETRSIMARLGKVLKGRDLENALAALRGDAVAPVRMSRDVVSEIESRGQGGPVVVVRQKSTKTPWKLYSFEGYTNTVNHLRGEVRKRMDAEAERTLVKEGRAFVQEKALSDTRADCVGG